MTRKTLTEALLWIKQNVDDLIFSVEESVTSHDVLFAQMRLFGYFVK